MKDEDFLKEIEKNNPEDSSVVLKTKTTNNVSNNMTTSTLTNENILKTIMKKDKPDKPGFVDKTLSKIISRKLFVFIIATGLMVWSRLNSETWGMVAMIYIGGQSIIDAVTAYRGGN